MDQQAHRAISPLWREFIAAVSNIDRYWYEGDQPSSGSFRSGSALLEIAGLHLDAVDVQIGNVDVPRLRCFRRQASRIDAGASVVEFIASAVRQRKAVVPVADAGQLSR
jgi:hypothetical protein